MHGEHGIDPTEPPAATPYPFPAISHEPRIEQLNNDLRSAGLHPFPLPNGILLDEAAPGASACIRCATCDGYACLANGKGRRRRSSASSPRCATRTSRCAPTPS